VLPFVVTTWEEWRTKYPQTLALVPDPAYKDQYEHMGGGVPPPGSGAVPPGGTAGSPFAGPPTKIVVGEWSGAAAPEKWGLRDDPRLPAREKIMGIEVTGGQKAYPLALLKQETVLNDRVGSTPVVVVHSAATDTTTVFSRRGTGSIDEDAILQTTRMTTALAQTMKLDRHNLVNVRVAGEAAPH